MKKKKQTGKKAEVTIKKEIGLRFKSFREAIEKTQTQLAGEFKVYQSTITNIEVGKTFPNIKYLSFLAKVYGLNADWIVNNRGEMFYDPCQLPKALAEKYSELLTLMQMPVVEQLILARLEEIKVILREDIRHFKTLQTGADSQRTS